MGTAQELEKLVIRLVGDGSSYKKVLTAAVADTEKAANQIKSLTDKEMGAHNKAMTEAARITAVVATPTEKYAQELEKLRALYKSGAISQETYTRALKMATAALPSVKAAQARYNDLMKKARGVIESVRTPLERYIRKLAELNIMQRKGAIGTATHAKAVNLLNREFSQGIYKVEAYGKKMQAIGRTMRNFGAIMLITVSLPILGAGVAMLKMAADAETTRVQFETMLGQDKGRGMLKTIREFAAVTPFRFPKLADSARTLLAFGVAQEDVMDTMKMLGDVSAGTGKDINELAIIFGQIRGMGRLQGQDFLQLVNAGFPVSEIAKTMGISMKDLKDKMEDGDVSFKVVEETFRRVTGEGGKFNNMMEKLSQTTSGKFSTLLDNIGLLATQMGEYLIPAANKVIDTLMVAVQWFSALDPAVHKTVMVLVGLVGVLGPVLIGIGSVVLLMGTLGVTFSAVVAFIGSAIVAGGSLLLTIGGWVLGIGAAIVAIKLLVDYIWGPGSFVAALKSAFKTAMNFAKNVVGFIANIGTNWGLLTEWLGENWRALFRDMGQALVVWISNTIHNNLTMIWTMVRLWVLWKGFMAQIYEKVFSVDFLYWIKSGVEKAADIFVEFVWGAWDALKSIFTGGKADGLAALAGRLGEELAGDFKTGMDTENIFKDGAAIIKDQVGKLKNGLDGFESTVGDLPDFVFKMGKDAEDEVDKAEEEVPVPVGTEKEKEKGKDDAAGEFKTMSLNRFSVNPVLAQGPKKQEVADTVVAGKLDELIAQGTGKPKTAVMAK